MRDGRIYRQLKMYSHNSTVRKVFMYALDGVVGHDFFCACTFISKS
jgi:hypothetical protein